MREGSTDLARNVFFSSLGLVGIVLSEGNAPHGSLDSLAFYAEHFHTVEVDSTFYACPPVQTVCNSGGTNAGRLFGACSRAVGPRAMVRDRAQYSESLNDSWKDQTLLNIVKLRYADPPTFVDIGSIVASYTLQQSATVGGTIQSPNGSAVLGAAGSFSNSPTITYTPLTGAKFIQSLMTPLPPASVFFAIQSGFPADIILFASVSSINGLRNQETTSEGMIPGDPDFHRARRLMRKIQPVGRRSNLR